MSLDDNLLLIGQIGDERIALPAGGIESVVELEALTPVPRAAPHIVGLAPLRSRVLTVVDSRLSIGIGRADLTGTLTCVVVTVDGHGYALLVDAVDDVVSAGTSLALNAGVSAAWRRVATGLVEVEGRALLLLDPAALIQGPAAALAA